MAYVALGPLGPTPALPVSAGLRHWRRLGPVHFEYDPDLDTDLNLFPNKDVVLVAEPVRAPDGTPSYAILHRPMWELGWIYGDRTEVYPPAGLEDERPGIWISYAPADLVRDDILALTRLGQHRLVGLPKYDFGDLRIDAGPPPIRVDEGWLLLHHGVAGELEQGWAPQERVRYAAGAVMLDPEDPGRVPARTDRPLE